VRSSLFEPLFFFFRNKTIIASTTIIYC
jgi:hypothetical protein